MSHSRLLRFCEAEDLAALDVRRVGEIGVGGGTEGMESASSVAALGSRVFEVGEEVGEDVVVRASSSQESGGWAGVDFGCSERVWRGGGRSDRKHTVLAWGTSVAKEENL